MDLSYLISEVVALALVLMYEIKSDLFVRSPSSWGLNLFGVHPGRVPSRVEKGLKHLREQDCKCIDFCLFYGGI